MIYFGLFHVTLVDYSLLRFTLVYSSFTLVYSSFTLVFDRFTSFFFLSHTYTHIYMNG